MATYKIQCLEEDIVLKVWSHIEKAPLVFGSTLLSLLSQEELISGGVDATICRLWQRLVEQKVPFRHALQFTPATQVLRYGDVVFRYNQENAWTDIQKIFNES